MFKLRKRAFSLTSKIKRKLHQKTASSGKVLWLTGLPGSGKTTLNHALAQKLRKQGHSVTQLDGDLVRGKLTSWGFSRLERQKHIYHMGFTASELEKAKQLVICSFVSPYEKDRKWVKCLCKDFYEIYISCPISECKKRDPKGMYKKADKGEIKNFTGVDAPYEAPSYPDVLLDTKRLSVDECVDKIIEKIF